MKVVAHHSEQELERLASREKRADLAKRLRTVLLAKQGFTTPEVATCTGFSRRTVQDWVARYNHEGLSGLNTRLGRGRKGPLTAEEAERLRRRIEAGPLPEDECACCEDWTSNGFCGRSSARSAPWIRFTACCTAWDSRPSFRDLSIPRRIPPPRKSSKKVGEQLHQIAAQHPGRRIQVFFEDEARFGQ